MLATTTGLTAVLAHFACLAPAWGQPEDCAEEEFVALLQQRGLPACTQRGLDPWSSGRFLGCCGTLRSCLVPGSPWHYLCLPSCPNSSEANVQITSFHWNVHWQCGQSYGHQEDCRRAAVARFGELARESGAEIAGAIELDGAAAALPNWTSTAQYADGVSLLLAPGWRLLKSGGGNLCCDGQRGIAVALVTPPQSIAGCPELCVMTVHPGHSPIRSGGEIVAEVCGGARQRCAVAVGDWNTDAAGVAGGSMDTWRRLIGGSPTVVAPDEVTCCWPHNCCRFDHLATNIAGASPVATRVWEYQLSHEFRVEEEHRPVAVTIKVPGEA